MESIDTIINHPNSLVSLACFSLVEGMVLYSNFAYLKHFQSNGKNKLLNINRGINYSARDEALHSMAGAYIFKEAKKISSDSFLPEVEEIVNTLVEHEDIITDMIFSEGDIDGITAKDMKTFVRSRANICLANLGFEPLYKIGDNPIAEWFYKGINNYQFNDFFTGQGREYTRGWDKTKFKWVVNE